jgi:hypothetical protein
MDFLLEDARERAKRRRQDRKRSIELPEGYHFLPKGDRLPVVVAARLSLSFPVLISAVPLYTIKGSAFQKHRQNDDRKFEPEDLQKHWFSDGGISSNFPIHFFDSWLPSRPTFGVKLTAHPKTAFQTETHLREDQLLGLPLSAAGQVDEARWEDAPLPTDLDKEDGYADVYLPKANAPLAAEWMDLSGDSEGERARSRPELTKFIWAIFSTAQNYRDNTQSLLPSYRERIIHVRLKKGEGGLNLAMDPKKIEEVEKKGARAGDLACGFNFKHHRWVRLRVLTAQLEGELKRIADLFNTQFDCDELFREQLAATKPQDRFPYPRDARWCKEALRRLGELVAIVNQWEPPIFGDEDPRPNPILRVTPRT